MARMKVKGTFATQIPGKRSMHHPPCMYTGIKYFPIKTAPWKGSAAGNL